MTKAKQDPMPPMSDEAKHNLIGFIETLIEIDQAEKARERRLQDEPKGYAIKAEGRSCHGCGTMLFDEDMWYDKWGMKCMGCQEVLNKKKIPGYVFKDYKNEKSVNLSNLSYKSGLHQTTLKKLVRQGKLKARVFKGSHGERWIFLRKDNPELAKIIEEERLARKRASKAKH